MTRKEERSQNGLRNTQFEVGFTKHAEGSCLIKTGDTWVLCTASVEERVPPWLIGKGKGWVTAEYAMLPRATNTRTRRDSSGRINGRSQEIQRLIGRSLRACIDLKALGERSITIDCDVLQADGGTRTASINAGFVALAIAIKGLQKKGKIATSPIHSAVSAISLGMKSDKILVDLNYEEDSSCDVDMNFVMLDAKKLVELQGTAEGQAFSQEDVLEMMEQAQKAIAEIRENQLRVLETSD